MGSDNSKDANQSEVDEVKTKYMSVMRSLVNQLKTLGEEESTSFMNIQSKLLNTLLHKDEFDILKQNFRSLLIDIVSNLSPADVDKNGLEIVVQIANYCSTIKDKLYSSIGTEILENLFKYSVDICSDVIQYGGLEAILRVCQSSHVETLLHGAVTLANLSLFGGSENQRLMIRMKVDVWLFPLAFHDNDNIKYYANLAIAALVANKENEAVILKSGILDRVEPFISSHTPEEFVNNGLSKKFLQKLVPVLSSRRKEAQSFSAFHFSIEAMIMKKQKNTKIFLEIGAIAALKKVAASPNAIASKCAAKALISIGEEVPCRLSEQVHLWTVEDVIKWVALIGFSELRDRFRSNQVDGDLLLQLTDEDLKLDIGIGSGILRKRFNRELVNLKSLTNYSSCDPNNFNQPDFDKQNSRYTHEKGKYNIFISYRRQTGSHLASLVHAHLNDRGFSAFLDVQNLGEGRFDIQLLEVIRHAKYFILILTLDTLKRCENDTECEDWVHKEIVTALTSKRKIIPIFDNFQRPELEKIPKDMREVLFFNGVNWNHDYQDECINKLKKFMRSDMNKRTSGNLSHWQVPVNFAILRNRSIHDFLLYIFFLMFVCILIKKL